MAVNKISEDGTLQIKKRIKVANKTSLENKIQLGIDCKEDENLFAIPGSESLRVLDMSKINEDLFNWESLELDSQVEIFHKGVISGVKWFLNQYLLTYDVNNNVKVWNYSYKTCLYEYTNSAAIIRVEFSPLNNVLVMNDFEGNLLISSNNFNLKAHKPKLKKEKEEEKKENKDKEFEFDIDKIVDECKNEITEQVNSINLDDEELNNIETNKDEKQKDNETKEKKENKEKDLAENKPTKENKDNTDKMEEDLLSLSEIEGEDGELKDASEIAKSNHYI